MPSSTTPQEPASPSTSTQTSHYTTPLFDLVSQNSQIQDELTQAFQQVLAQGKFVLGPFVEQFEQDLAEHLGAKHVLGVSSGTDALLVAMMALGIGPGDEVITTPFTWFSTASSIARLGARPVFVDINPRTYCIEPDGIEAAITSRTKAILPVHLFGLPASMNRINEIANKHGLKVIEDAAQSLGSVYHGKPAGTLGDVACLSFYPTKNLAALGDAGAVVTHDDQLAEKIRRLRNHGLDPNGPTGFDFPMIGGNFRMSGMQGAFLSVKLKYLNDWIQTRHQNAERYHVALENTPITTPFEPATRGHVYHQYAIRVRSDMRNAVMYHLKACHIQTRIFYAHPLHLQPCFAELGYKKNMLPEAELAAREALCLPISPEMSHEEQERVISSIQEFFRAE